MKILAPISVGELFDKITILRIKQARINDPAKLANVRAELAELTAIVEAGGLGSAELDRDVAALQAVNAELWDVEDAKRDHERRQVFDDAFVRLARDVYLKNDRRAEIKRRINLTTGSLVVEEKAYRDYGGGAEPG
ncbi:MAG: hypothetical protein DI565_15840 [Ancylobacter novellus]|uniref:Uncharacterized protein n=1 Tax=Ancylobacter novellus TaxID=921 RepID=A0A2W5M0E1_ANCNO|nr:MAG: hypothetical protein DI565_15840 [Ancylobacter novellus]